MPCVVCRCVMIFLLLILQPSKSLSMLLEIAYVVLDEQQSKYQFKQWLTVDLLCVMMHIVYIGS